MKSMPRTGSSVRVDIEGARRRRNEASRSQIRPVEVFENAEEISEEDKGGKSGREKKKMNMLQAIGKSRKNEKKSL